MSLTVPSIWRFRSNCSVIWRVAERARRRHLGETRDLAELEFERRRHRRRHGLRIRARQLRRDLKRRIVDVRQGCDRQQRIGDQAAGQKADHQERGRDRPLDEGRGYVHGIDRLLCLLHRRFVGRFAVQDRDMRARLQLVLSVDHDLLAGLQAGIDQRLAVGDLRDLERADRRPCCRA